MIRLSEIFRFSFLLKGKIGIIFINVGYMAQNILVWILNMIKYVASSSTCKLIRVYIIVLVMVIRVATVVKRRIVFICMFFHFRMQFDVACYYVNWIFYFVYAGNVESYLIICRVLLTATGQI